MDITEHNVITLRKNSDRRVRKGHMWVFSNEIQDPSVSSLEPGHVYELVDHAKEFIGMVYANPASLITARIFSRRKCELDADLLKTRIEDAWLRRKSFMGSRDHYRMVFGESDLLPGLIVDKYGSVLVMQTLTAGMDRVQETIVNELVNLVNPECVFLKNDSQMRSLEGLSLEKRPAYGSVPSDLSINSFGLNLFVDFMDGQKTGYFLDQESNRDLMQKYVSEGSRVLDLFCYSGAWGLHAAKAGAGEVSLVDSSQPALDIAARNIDVNGLNPSTYIYKSNVLDFLKREHSKWDLIVLDPPGFIKNRLQFKDGLKGYIDINRRALSKLNPNGILVTCSCSHHMDQQNFEEMAQTAARQTGHDLRILEIRGQGPDHAFLPSVPETRYLKVIVAQIIS